MLTLTAPGPDLEALANELLTLLAEEAAELIVEVAKWQRFGGDTVWRDSTPRDRLSRELGQLMFVAEELLDRAVLDRETFLAGHGEKPAAMRTWTTHWAAAVGE